MTSPRKNFFISYTSVDRDWAVWIAWVLDEAGYTTVLQDRDFHAGSNFVSEMHQATEAQRTIAVLSPAYLESSFAESEWAAAFGSDPKGTDRKLVPVRVEECKPRGLLASVVYIDLVGLDRGQARAQLLSKLQSRPTTGESPGFPGAAQAPPSFPGADTGVAPTGNEDGPSTHQRAMATDSSAGATWVKVNQLIFAVDEVDDQGTTVELQGPLGPVVKRALNGLMSSRFGGGDVRLVCGDRVLSATIAGLRDQRRNGRAEVTVKFDRAEPVPLDRMRASTAGYSPNELAELGVRALFLGESLPDSLLGMEFLTETGIDEEMLAHAYQRADPEAGEATRLLVLEGLVTKGHASYITQLELGPATPAGRAIFLEWCEARIYDNVEPQLRSIRGTWQPPA